VRGEDPRPAAKQAEAALAEAEQAGVPSGQLNILRNTLSSRISVDSQVLFASQGRLPEARSIVAGGSSQPVRTPLCAALL